MFVICTLLLSATANPTLAKADVEGKILKESGNNYLVDFSRGINEYTVKGDLKDYSKILVKKSDCIKEP